MLPLRSVAVASIRNRADMTNSLFVTDAEIVELANSNLAIAYNACITAYGDNTFAVEYIISGIGANVNPAPTVWPEPQVVPSGAQYEQTRFALPAAFRSLLRCEFVNGTVSGHADSGGVSFTLDAGQPNRRWTPIHPLDVAGMVYDSTPRDWLEGHVGYWITAFPSVTPPLDYPTGDTTTTFWIAFLPVPKAVVSVHLLYVPGAPKYGTTDDASAIRLPEEVWRFVREATAADMLEKQRSDSSILRGNAQLALDQIINSKIVPDLANPPQTVDVYGGSGISPYGRRRNVWR